VPRQEEIPDAATGQVEAGSRIRDCNPNPGIPVELSNPIIPGLAAFNPGFSGFKNCLLNAYKSVTK